MLNKQDLSDLESARVGSVVTLSDGRVVRKVYSENTNDCIGCLLDHDNYCRGCDENIILKGVRMKICTFAIGSSFYEGLDNILKERRTSSVLNKGFPNNRKIIQLERNETGTMSVLTSYDKVSFRSDEQDTMILFLSNEDFMFWIDYDMKNNIIKHN